MNFSRRTDWNLTENDLTRDIREAKLAGRELLDLTVSNPTACGFEYDNAAILESLSTADAITYRPDAFGMLRARKAVKQYYLDHGTQVSVEQICLTTSTSEAYSFLFRLLCDPDDEVLIARPSYPLFDFIAKLDDVKLVEYALVYDDGWQIDFLLLEALITYRTKAVVVVHPNNPTGNYASDQERATLDEICARYGLALIVDEVFLDYSFTDEAWSTLLSAKSDSLTFVLSGISKVCALPQMKLSWVAASGPRELVYQALERLEVIADTFLSVNAPTQYALPIWLTSRGHLQNQIRERIRTNLAILDNRLHGSHANRLSLRGGWTAVLRVPRFISGVTFAEAALSQDVVVQPGEFYGLTQGHIVLSLLTPTEVWRRGLARLPIH